MASLFVVLLVLFISGCPCARVPNSPFPVAANGLNASTHLRVAFTDGLSQADSFTLQVLQGVVNKRAPTLARAARGSDAEMWLNITRNIWGVTLDSSLPTLASLVAFFGPGLQGYVLCSLLDNSTNAALAAAAALNVLVVTPSNEALAAAANLSLLYDVRGHSMEWALETFNATLPSGFTFSRSVTTLQLPSESVCCMSDYSVAMGALQWWDDNVTSGVAQRVWGSMLPPFAMLGWGPDELGSVTSVSRFGGGVAASNFAANLDVLSNFDLPQIKQQQQQQQTLPLPTPLTPVHTVCFLMSDGDNVQFLLDGFATDERWWGSPARGSVPLGWTLSAPTADLAPVVPAHLFAQQTPADGFVAGVSGAGYFFPDSVLEGAGQGALDALTALSAAFMAKNDLRLVNVLGRSSVPQRAVVESYLQHDAIDALFFYPYSDYSGLHGSITWSSNGKPIIGGRFNLWGNGSSPQGPTFFNATGLASALLAQARDPGLPAGYSLVPLHAWSHTPADAAQVMALVSAAAPGAVEAVTPAQFVARIIANVKQQPPPSAPSRASAAATVANVVVFGGTPAAVVSAIAAARGNVSAALVDTSQRLGGLMSGGLGYTDVGDSFAIGGLAKEVFLRNARHYNSTATEPLYQVESHVIESIFAAMLGEAGVQYISAPGATIDSVTLGGGGVRALTLSTGVRASGSVFIDASYEGDLLAAAGRFVGSQLQLQPLAGITSAPLPPRGPIQLTFGREGEGVYNETWAGRKEPFGTPFDLRPISPLDSSGALLPLLTARTFAPLGSGDALTQGYNFRLCAVKRSESPSHWLPMPQPAPYDPGRWELLRRFAALPSIANTTAHEAARLFFSLGPLPSSAKGVRKYDMNNGCLISTDFTGGSWAYPTCNASQRALIWSAHKEYMLQFFHVLSTDPAIAPAIRAGVADVGLCSDEFPASGGWPEQLYVREVVRLVGDAVLTQNQVWSGGQATPTPASDWGNASIGMGSYAADGHYAQRGPCVGYQDKGGQWKCRMATSEAEIEQASAAGLLWTGGEGYVGSVSTYMLYQIPYFVLLPRRQDANNVLSPTCPSVSHVVFASLRVEPTFMVLGQGAGVAAALAVKQDCSVHDVPLANLKAELLRQGAVTCHDKFPHC